MARPIALNLPPRDPREELRERLERAPLDHAEALLAGYDVLEKLHEARVLEAASGALGSGGAIVDIVVDVAKSPEVIQGMRNLIILSKMLGSMDPEMLNAVARAVAATFGTKEKPAPPPPGIFALMRGIFDARVRRALGLGTKLLEAVGKQL